MSGGQGAGRHRSTLAAVAMAMALVGCSSTAPSGSPTPVPPRELTVSVVARTDQAPVANAAVEIGQTTVTTDQEGRATVTAASGQDRKSVV